MKLFKLVLIIVVAIGLITVTLLAIDSSSLPIKQDEGIIISKYIGYTDSKYNVIISINGLTDNITLSKSDYDLLIEGKPITCYYSTGRLFNTVYVSYISIEI